MKKIFVAVFALFLTFGLSVGEAGAARMGGGKSFGMQRQSVAPRPARQATAPAPTSPATAPAATPKRNWMGPIAGLAAGLGIAALDGPAVPRARQPQVIISRLNRGRVLLRGRVCAIEAVHGHSQEQSRNR